MSNSFSKPCIAVIGLGYVGLPLAIEFSKFFRVIGFDINSKKIISLKKGIDENLEIKNIDFKKKNILFTNNPNTLHEASFFIICVPTPILPNFKPDLSYIINATKLVGGFLKKGDLVIYESTVFPGCTEDICNPILERISKLKINKDYILGYSPERINPGDKKRKLTKIAKVISASSKVGLIKIYKIYSKVIKAKIYKATSIKVAEASKILENVQRSLNISLINEVSVIFKKMNINTKEVIEAARTKWNFMDYRPGLVGGHCIAVDPYYLSYKAKELGVSSKLILSGQEINESIPKLISDKILKILSYKKRIHHKILILGVTFKENCPDLRDSKVINIIDNLSNKKNQIFIFDPWTKKESLKKTVNKKIIFLDQLNINSKFDVLIIAVRHKIFKKIGIKKIKNLLKKDGYIYDVKNFFHQKYSNETL
jgi:UDP-N-acetyl-D-galactosamine dehydrogenase